MSLEDQQRGKCEELAKGVSSCKRGCWGQSWRSERREGPRVGEGQGSQGRRWETPGLKIQGSCPLTSQTVPTSGAERPFCLCPCLSQASLTCGATCCLERLPPVLV